MATTTTTITPQGALSAEENGPLTPEELVRQLRALRARTPLPLPLSGRVPAGGPLVRVDAQFVAASINAIGASENVQRAVGRSDEDLRQEADAIVRWSAVADEYRACLEEILAGNVVRRRRLGLTALQTYKICAQLVRDDTHSGLLPFVAEMRRLNRFGKSRRRATAAPPSAPSTGIPASPSPSSPSSPSPSTP